MDSHRSSAPPPPQYISQHLTTAHHSQQQHNLSNNLQNPPPFPFNHPMNPPPPDHHQSGGGSGGGFAVEPAKKKRGRPRKYSQDDGIGLGLSPQPINHVSSAHAESSDTPAKKHRGRPPGSGKKQMDALGIPGVGFTPHVITVNAGEDIATKVMAFAQEGPRTVCIMSASGAICNVTIRQPSMSGGTVTYEGRFEIITLTGSFPLSDDNGRGRTGGLSISLSGSDNRVLGGEVAGILKAASPVQVIVGSFIADGKKPKYNGPSTTPRPSQMLNFGSSSPGGSSESAEENDDSPLNHNSGHYGNSGQPIHSVPMYSNMVWPNSIKLLPN